jgi:hypothetical protein
MGRLLFWVPAGFALIPPAAALGANRANDVAHFYGYMP